MWNLSYRLIWLSQRWQIPSKRAPIEQSFSKETSRRNIANSFVRREREREREKKEREARTSGRNDRNSPVGPSINHGGLCRAYQSRPSRCFEGSGQVQSSFVASRVSARVTEYHSRHELFRPRVARAFSRWPFRTRMNLAAWRKQRGATDVAHVAPRISRFARGIKWTLLRGNALSVALFATEPRETVVRSDRCQQEGSKRRLCVEKACGRFRVELFFVLGEERWLNLSARSRSNWEIFL